MITLASEGMRDVVTRSRDRLASLAAPLGIAALIQPANLTEPTSRQPARIPRQSISRRLIRSRNRSSKHRLESARLRHLHVHQDDAEELSCAARSTVSR
jgi:hypothetical protein